MTIRLFGMLSKQIKSHFLLTRWTDGEFGAELDKLSISHTSSWLGMFSRRLDWHNLKMTLHCLTKLPILYQDFLRLVKSYQPDVIYIGAYHEIILLFPLLKTMKVPVIYHVHNILPGGRFYDRSFNMWSKTIHHYIAVSESVGNSIKKHDIPSQVISVLYNGIDLSLFPYIEKRSILFTELYGWSEDSVIIGMTGQMFEGKGHLDFLQAANLVHKELPRARFVIGGHQHGDYYQELQKRVRELDLGDVVSFSGWEKEMSRFYSNIDIFVLPTSQDGEGFPLVIVEAMSIGLPVVVTRSGGAGESVDHGKSGLLIDRQSPGQLADALHLLVRSPEMRRSMGETGRKRAKSMFDLSQQAHRFEEIVKSVANSHGH